MYAWCVLIGSERKKEKRKEQDVFKIGSMIVENRTANNFQKKGKIRRKRLTLYVAHVRLVFFFVICLPPEFLPVLGLMNR